MECTDQLHRKLKLEKLPQRIISLVPSQTELLVDLGLENKIVGLTHFCVHPKEIRKNKIRVGGTKSVHFEKIKDLAPDIILCNKEENTKEIVERLAKDFIVHVSDVNNLEENYEMIIQYGKLFDVEAKSNEILTKTQSEVEKFQSFLVGKPQLKISYFIWKNPWMVVGKGTFINYLLELNGFENVYSDKTRYPEIQLEQLKPVDFHLLSSEPFPFGEKEKNELKPFVGKSRICFVDGEYFSWYGSRLTKAFQYFQSLRKNMEKMKSTA
ncbi:MAG: helical backbone metal receptor [Weeksellaceae bacterium]|jgi:ABC-type Fe3+-hydroxamate transport system substrate-binding protein|nr:helical backbone metal receptor [Weeksellaceae bacterium]